MEIRKATPDDREQIGRWLLQEKDDGHDSFIVNFNLIEEGQEDGSLTVLIEDGPIAFALGNDNLAILAVKRDRRKNGVGRTLAEHWFQQARDRDLMGFHGECAPRNSLGFWKKMGCHQVKSPYSGSDAPWVVMPFPKKHDFATAAQTVAVSFGLVATDGRRLRQWDHSTEAAVIEPDDLMLAEDFVAFVPETDTRVVVTVDGSNAGDVRVRDIGDFGGVRNYPWVRVRELALP